MNKSERVNVKTSQTSCLIVIFLATSTRPNSQMLNNNGFLVDSRHSVIERHAYKFITFVLLRESSTLHIFSSAAVGALKIHVQLDTMNSATAVVCHVCRKIDQM
jgi:hypothetical protein